MSKVHHPKELGDAAVGNPITFLIMIIVGAVIAKASAVIAACASLIGTGFSAVNIIEGCKMITKVAEGYDSISDVNAAKVSAKDCARGIALLGVEIIPVLFGLIKRGIAKYNGKEIKVGENARARTQNELADIVGKNINDVGSIEGYEKFTRKDGTIGLRRQKGKAGQLDQLSVDKDGNIIRIENKTAAMPPVNTVKGPKYNSCPDSSPCAKNAVEIIENNNQFVWVEEKARWFSPDGKRQIWFEDGWKYKGDGGIIGEFTVVEKHSMCKTTYKTSTTGNGSFMNGHHGIQSDWAETRINQLSMKILGKKIYFEKDAPAVLLRDTYGGTPHQNITKSQQSVERTGNIPISDYIEQRKNALSDLENVACPSENVTKYLEWADKYFGNIYRTLKDAIKKLPENEQKIAENELKDIFGNYFENNSGGMIK